MRGEKIAARYLRRHGFKILYRNFRGRQGPGARTHLMSPAMVAAAAVSGHLADVRPLLAGRKA